MTTLVDRLETQRAEQQSSTALSAPRRDIFADLASEKTRQEFALALPKVAGLTVERFTRVALTTIRTTPKLIECSRISLLSALVTTAQLGLEPGGPLGHAYLVPFFNKDRGMEVTLIVGYQGYIVLAYRSGEVDNVSAELVREGDDFDVVYGAHRDLTHKPNKYDRSGKVLGSYAVCALRDNRKPVFEWLTTAQVETDHRARSRAKNSGPWVTDWDMMARKTAVRALKPFMPTAVQSALAQADAVDDTPLTIESVLTDDGTDGTGKPIVIDSQPASNGGSPAPPAETETKPKRSRGRKAQTAPEPAAPERTAAVCEADANAAGHPSPDTSPPGPTAPPDHPPSAPSPPPDRSHGTASHPTGDADPVAASAAPPGATPGAESEPPASTARMREIANEIITLRNDALLLSPQVSTRNRERYGEILADVGYRLGSGQQVSLWINSLGHDELTRLVAAYRAVLWPPPAPEQTELPT